MIRDEEIILLRLLPFLNHGKVVQQISNEKRQNNN
jgi:hypothetical protein